MRTHYDFTLIDSALFSSRHIDDVTHLLDKSPRYSIAMHFGMDARWRQWLATHFGMDAESATAMAAAAECRVAVAFSNDT